MPALTFTQQLHGNDSASHCTMPEYVLDKDRWEQHRAGRVWSDLGMESKVLGLKCWPEELGDDEGGHGAYARGSLLSVPPTL